MPAEPRPLRCLAAALAGLVLSAAAPAAPVHKCTTEAGVSYQSTPCPSATPRQAPTVEQLNAERRRQREAAPPPAARASAAAAAAPNATRRPPVPAAAPAPAYRCDGRQYCSQMSSCAEAKYFLANCRNVKMDGDGDGIPCEEQWCGH